MPTAFIASIARTGDTVKLEMKAVGISYEGTLNKDASAMTGTLPDFVNDNSQTDQSTDGNAAGVMFLEFLTDYLGVPMDTILGHMPTTGGAPLGLTYVALLQALPALGPIAGADGTAAFQKMISLLTQNTQSAEIG